VTDKSRTALVTGVSRQRGIGFAIARRLLADGARVFIHSWTPYDATEPWGADSAGIAGVVEALGGEHAQLAHAEADFEDIDVPRRLVTSAVERFGHLDTLVVNHARSSIGNLAAVTAEELDCTWAVNVRATLLLVQAFAEHCPSNGRVVLFTSGQHLAPMSQEIPYATTKGALHQLTLTLSDALIDQGITVNCVNPGPTDTGWATDEVAAAVRQAMPRGRWNTPDEIAGVVALLLTDDAASITGRVIDAEAGFRRWKM
jgi:3-oxoacyl-[acyl-carrier protein] reductase